MAGGGGGGGGGEDWREDDGETKNQHIVLDGVKGKFLKLKVE